MSRSRSVLCVAAVVVAVIVLRERQALAAMTVQWSNFENLQGVYFAPTMSPERRRSFLDELESARRRVASFYGTLRARPTLIVADRDSASRFMEGATAVTHYRPTGVIIVFGPEGRATDVVAHELAHAEMFARVGYRTAAWCTPTWFDEGLAVQFDARPFYGEAALEQRRREGWPVPPLTALGTRADFFVGSRERVRFHYAVARSAVQSWLRARSTPSAVERLERYRCGDGLPEEVERMASD